MEIALLKNQLVIMKALILITTDEEVKQMLKNQIAFTESRIRGLQ